MKVTLTKLDPVAVKELALEVTLEDVEYKRFLLEIDGKEYMITEDSAYILPTSKENT